MTEVKTKSETNSSRATQKAQEDVKNVTTGFAPEAAVPIPIADSVQFSAEAMKHWLETGQDMARFYNARLAKDFRYLGELGTCRSPMQVANLWCRMTSETAHDYADQLDRLMTISMNGAATPPERA